MQSAKSQFFKYRSEHNPDIADAARYVRREKYLEQMEHYRGRSPVKVITGSEDAGKLSFSRCSSAASSKTELMKRT